MKLQLKLFLIMAVMSLFSLAASAQSKYENLSNEQFEQLIAKHGVQILDVRTAEEYAEGHIAGSLQADVNADDFLAVAKKKLHRKGEVAVYCRSGRRSRKACDILSAAGYKVSNLDAGILGWTEAGKPVTKN